jgi:hypothetical protein
VEGGGLTSLHAFAAGALSVTAVTVFSNLEVLSPRSSCRDTTSDCSESNTASHSTVDVPEKIPSDILFRKRIEGGGASGGGGGYGGGTVSRNFKLYRDV